MECDSVPMPGRCEWWRSCARIFRARLELECVLFAVSVGSWRARCWRRCRAARRRRRRLTSGGRNCWSTRSSPRPTTTAIRPRSPGREISWKGSNGLAHSTNRTKCASLVTQLLEKAYDPDFVGWFGCTSPHAAAYHDAIEVEDGFDLIESIFDIQPGDIVAIRYDDAGCSQLTCGTFTGCTTSGHVAIVAAAPTLRSPVSPLVGGTVQYALPIIDSSSTYHGVTDTRYKSDALGADDKGVGRGTMRLYVDSADPERPIVGYSWSNVAGSLFYPHSKRDLVIGRYRP
jgi:hypothetical protein